MANDDSNELLRTGVVRSVDYETGYAYVELYRQDGCGRCHQPGGCGGQSLSRFFCRKEQRWRVACPPQLRPGDEVEISIVGSAVRQASTRAYGVPLLFMLAGAVVGDLVFGDVGALSGAMVGLLPGWWLLYQSRSRAAKGDFVPYIKSWVSQASQQS